MKSQDLIKHIRELNLPEFAGLTDDELLRRAIAPTGVELPKPRTLSTEEKIELGKSQLQKSAQATRTALENSTFVYDNKLWQCDRESRTRLYGLASLSEEMFPSGRFWRAADNVDVPITYAYVQGLIAALEQYTNDLFLSAQSHKDAIGALTTQEEVNAYDVLSGWPTNTL